MNYLKMLKTIFNIFSTNYNEGFERFFFLSQKYVPPSALAKFLNGKCNLKFINKLKFSEKQLKMQQIQNEEDQIVMSRQDANSLIPSVESAYHGLLIKGLYLPKLTSSIITADYLLKVLFDQVFVLEIEDIKIGTLLRPELNKLELPNGLSWGITSKNQPDKVWAVNVLKTLSPNHIIFQKYEEERFDMKKFSAVQIRKMKELDYSRGKKAAVRRFFRIDKAQQVEIEQKRKMQAKKNLENKINRKKQKIQESQLDIQEMGLKIQQI